MNLAGQSVIVTGSTSGIGEAVARRLAGLGASVVINSSGSVAQGERLAAELLATVTWASGDLASRAD